MRSSLDDSGDLKGHEVHRTIPRALSIGGSDSGGGAGIQADLKTFAALKVHGLTAVTAVTAQNTLKVSAIQGISPEVVRAQIDVVFEDMGVDAGKTGMLWGEQTVRVVAEEVRSRGFPLVVDPVISAKDGSRLLEEEGVRVLVDELIPEATLVTPNVDEAAIISGFEVRTLEDAKRAAEKTVELGAKAVLVKGGHLSDQERAVDVLYHDGEFTILDGVRLKARNTHGTGCCLSAAIAAGLARGEDIDEAVRIGKDFVTSAIRYGLSLGRGFGPVDPVADLHKQAERYEVVLNVLEAGRMLESSPEVSGLVPECQMNLVMALPYAVSLDEVAGIPGRIVRVDRGVRMSSCPRFGVSRHVAGTLLTVMSYSPDVRSGLNIRYSDEVIGICKKLDLIVSEYDRREEPDEIKRLEGMSTRWGAETAIKRAGRVPDVIYHLGDWGKEPMVTLLGRTATDVAKTATRIAQILVRKEP